MKEVSFEATIAGCTTQDFYELACSEPTALLEFHRQVNKDDSVEVYWEDDSKKARLCTYTLKTIAIPSSLQSFVGAGPILVKEKQVFTWLDKDTLKIVSRPMVQITYGKAMRTEAEMLLRPTSDGCQFDVKARVTARLPWAMQYLTSTIETMMAAEARRTVAQYVNFITKFVEDGLNNLHEQQRQQQQQQQQREELNQMVVQEQQQAEEMVLDLAGSEASGGSEAGAEAVIIQHQHQQQQLLVASPTTGKPSAALASATTTTLHVQATSQGAAAPAAAAAGAAVPARTQAVPSGSELDVFFDAQEVSRTDQLLEQLVRELQAAKDQHQEANRLLEEMKESVIRVEQAVTKEIAFQEGIRFAQRNSYTTLMLSVAAAAAAASAVTALLVSRRSK